MSNTSNIDKASSNKTTPTTVEAMLKTPQYLNALQRALPAHITPDRIASVALTALRKNPKLAKADQVSLFGAIITCSQNGWEISKDCHLLPFTNNRTGGVEVNLIPDYRGLIKLALNSDMVSKVEAHVVYENDMFDFELGLQETLRHRPAMANRGEIICAYAIVTLTDGNKQYEVMTMDDLEAVRQRSKSKDSGPWKTDTAMMYRKSCIRRVLRYVGSSAELNKAMDMDNDADLERQNNKSWYTDGETIEGEATVVPEQPAPTPQQEERKPEPKKRGRPRKQQQEEPPTQPPAEEPAAGPGTNSSGDEITYAKVAEGIRDSKSEQESQSWLNSAAGVLPADQASELAALHVEKYKQVGDQQ